MKVYSKIDEIPCGQASEKLTDACLVLEGGAFRGLYSQGYLDALMENDLNFSCVIGVSAGALAGMNYVAGQIGRSARVNLTYRHDRRYVGTRALLHSHSILDVGFLTEDREIFEPLDKERFFRKEQRFIAVATNCMTGKAEYFEKGKCKDIFAAVKASATMPFISPSVEIDGIPYFDGGCSCKIPYKWALRQNYEKIVVIRTRDTAFRKKEKEMSISYRVYRKYPQFARRQARSDIAYNKQCDELQLLHEEGRLYQLAPSEAVAVRRIESDMEKLGELYWLGYHDCINNLAELKHYLEIES